MSLRSIQLVPLALVLAAGCQITPEQFDKKFLEKLCEEYAACNPEVACDDEGTSTFDTSDCLFDPKAAKACLKGEWVCDDSNPDFPIVEAPPECNKVYDCGRRTTTGTGTGEGTGTGTTGTGTGTTGTGTGGATGTGTGTGITTFELELATEWFGQQTFSVAFEEPVPDQFNCVLAYDTVGTPVTPIPAECPLCAFVFDLAFTYNAAASVDDGSCAAVGFDQLTGYTYAVRDDGNQLTMLLMDYQGNFFDFGTVVHDGQGGITFEGGTLNQPFGAGYNSGYWQGTATLAAR